MGGERARNANGAFAAPQIVMAYPPSVIIWSLGEMNRAHAALIVGARAGCIAGSNLSDPSPPGAPVWRGRRAGTCHGLPAFDGIVIYLPARVRVDEDPALPAVPRNGLSIKWLSLHCGGDARPLIAARIYARDGWVTVLAASLNAFEHAFSSVPCRYRAASSGLVDRSAD